MSDHYIILIPTRPEYVPDIEAQQKAQQLYASFVPNADEVEASITNEVEFVVSAANFERVSCPFCNAELSMDWWSDAMDKAYETRFANLEAVTPCCHTVTSLNDLQYKWPAGFARFILKAHNPDVRAIGDEQIAMLEQILDCKLRKVWAHI